MADSAMEVEDEGLRLYSELLKDVLSSESLLVGEQMIAEKQLEIYHLAAQMHSFREPLLSFWCSGQGLEAVPELFGKSLGRVKKRWEEEGTWMEMKTKKVFGHSAVRFLTVPNFPSSTKGSCVFLQRQHSLWNFTPGCGKDPLADLETKGFAILLRMDSFLKGGVVLVCPTLQHGKPLVSEEADLPQLIMKEPELWRRLVKTDQDLFSSASLAYVKQVLKVGANMTPRKPRPDLEDVTPEKPSKPSQDLAHEAYGKLLASMLKEMNCFTEPFQGLRWLENKKQLLVYHHAARMHELRETILGHINGAEVTLEPHYQRAVDAVKGELMGLFDGKVKKLFSHDHVIRFHTVKGLPVPRECCVFLRERPQCSSDVLRKTPSIFRDLIRYRGQTSPLLELERQHLALVLTVTDRLPRAWLVVSPLLSKPELLELVGKEDEMLKEELVSLIRRESDVWRAFIQRHADVVGKESLKIIQKVLKGCQPGSGLGEFSLRMAEDVDEANEARELAEMRLAEASQRWVMGPGMQLLTAEKKVKQLTQSERRWKIRSRHQASLLAAQKEDGIEAERLQAEERLEQLKKVHRDEMAQMHKDCEEAKRVAAQQELQNLKLEEEVQIMQDSQQELLQTIGHLDDAERRDRRKWRVKNAALKQQLKHGHQVQKEQLTKATREAQAKIAEMRTAMSQEASVLQEAVAFQEASQRRLQAQLEVQTAALQRTTQLNTELRSRCSLAEEDTSAAKEAAAAAKVQEAQVNEQLKLCQKELDTARDKVQQEMKDLEASQAEAQSALERSRAESSKLEEEVHHLKESCRAIRVDAAKATLLEREHAKLQTQLTEISIQEAQTVERLTRAQEEVQELQHLLRQRQGQLDHKIETLSQLQERNKVLQVTAAEAAERESLATSELRDLQQHFSQESSALKAARDALAAAEAAEEIALQRQHLAEEQRAAAMVKMDEAEARRGEEQCRARLADEALEAIEKREMRLKAELTCHTQEAQRLTQQCARLCSEKALAEAQASQGMASAEQAENSLRAKEAELQVLQTSLRSVQDSNRGLRADCADAQAASKEAHKALQAAELEVEEAKGESKRAWLQVDESKQKLTLAEEGLRRAQQEAQELRQQCSQLEQLTQAESASMAHDSERKLKSQVAAQAAEAQRLSTALARSRLEVAEARQRGAEAEARRRRAEAERGVALAASELSQEDVRRLADSAPHDRLQEDLEALLSSEDLEAASKRPRLEGPTRRIRFKCSGV